MNFEQKLTSSDQEDFEKKRRAYQRNAEKVASEANSFKENLTGNGFSAEDVFRYEADEENKRENELVLIRKKIEESGPEKNPELLEQEDKQQARLSKEHGSSLLIESISTLRERMLSPWKEEQPSTRRIRGLIDGVNVKIEAKPKKSWSEIGKAPYSIFPEEHPDYFEFKGVLDDKKISSEDAKNLFIEYRQNSAERINF